MTRQYIALSIVLLISVIVNVGFIFDKFTSSDEQIPIFSTDKPISPPISVNLQAQTVLLQDTMAELSDLKTIAQSENAPDTIKTIDHLISAKQSQLNMLNQDTSKTPAGHN